MSSIPKNFIGYLNTPVLWQGKNSWGITQYSMQKSILAPFNSSVEKRLRLGKLVERFVGFELKQHENIKIIVENLQIQKQKRTIGEIDCILKQDDQLIHLEIVYKFYLYDPEVGTTEFEHWIGPNRKDSFIEKLTKLKEKQLPLLYNPETKKYLDALQMSSETIIQHVYFKAQLFVPIHLKTNAFKDINSECIVGFYVSFNNLKQFEDCKFSIPEKIDWLCDIEIQCAWLTFSNFITELEPLISRQTSPLCWIKYPNGITEKCFVVWW
ncbi:DUF1853 family protein [Formosa sp. PL04]|uniref:DUF1853 family protein n=1 Tax=Formosa sp. PL04 TaxID=3081755 RepID=UPI002980BFE4|nr:DUF1853 family protein [Formosa sp. PL04]MDW5288704.1 DUF1853 family protein [Formosa sp. PL04]